MAFQGIIQEQVRAKKFAEGMKGKTYQRVVFGAGAEELRTGINHRTGEPLNKIETAQRWASIVSMLALVVVGGYYGVKTAKKLNSSEISVPKKASGADIPKSSKSSAQYQKYKNELTKGDILENSKSIISGSDLKDPKVISELTKNGSSMSDWAKMESTYSYETSMGKGKVHYYQNLKTGEISFYDVKMKVSIPKDLKIRNGLTDDFWIIDLDNNFIPKEVR